MPRTTKTTAKDKAPHTVPPEEHTANTGRPDATAATQLNKKSWAQNHRAATEQDVRYELEDYYSFLHFLALYCKPMLDKNELLQTSVCGFTVLTLLLHSVNTAFF